VKKLTKLFVERISKKFVCAKIKKKCCGKDFGESFVGKLCKRFFKKLKRNKIQKNI
jgi:hypothetical protein